MSIHPTALVDPSASLGAGVTIGPYAVIEGDVTVGAGTTIGSHAVICRYTTLGERCRVHAHAVIGDTPQDLGFRDVPSYTRIGNDVVLREGVTIHRGTKEGTTTEVGDGCFLMANSHLAHNVQLGKQVILANAVLLAGYVVVGDKCFIGGNSAAHQFCRIGRLAMVGGGVSLSVDAPPFCMVRTGSLNEVAGLNTVGLRRSGITSEERLALRAAFRRIFLSGSNRKEVLAALRQDGACGPVLELIDFVATSKRGVCHSRRDRTVRAEETD